MAATTRKKKVFVSEPTTGEPPVLSQDQVGLCKMVSPGICTLHTWKGQNGFGWTERYCRVPSHYQAPSCFSATLYSRTLTAGAAYVPYSRSNNTHIPSHPLGHFPPHHFLVSLPGKGHHCPLWFSYLPCTLVQKVYSFTKGVEKGPQPTSPHQYASG